MAEEKVVIHHRQESPRPVTREIYVTEPPKDQPPAASHPVFAGRPLNEQDKALAELQEKVRTLFDAIAHGDEEHRAWLSEAIFKHFASQPVPAPPSKL